ncbi:MAG TPA: hypothetical protein VKZ89_11215 [Thermobifida alba]|nr:hypothetical protein [Thermobifida alba]
MPYLTAVAHTTDEDVWTLDISIERTWRAPVVFDNANRVLWQVATDLPASSPVTAEQLTHALALAGFEVKRGWERPAGWDAVAGADRDWLRQAHVRPTSAPRSLPREPGEMPDPITVRLSGDL